MYVFEILDIAKQIWLSSTAFACVQGVPGLNLNQETEYPDWGFMVFLSPSSKMLGQYFKKAHGHFLSGTIEPIIIPYHLASFVIL